MLILYFAAIVLVGNKADLEEERKVLKENAENYAREINADYHEVSAKTNEGSFSPPLSKLFQNFAAHLFSGLNNLFQAIVRHTYQALLQNAAGVSDEPENVAVDGNSAPEKEPCC